MIYKRVPKYCPERKDVVQGEANGVRQIPKRGGKGGGGRKENCNRKDNSPRKKRPLELLVKIAVLWGKWRDGIFDRWQRGQLD